MLKDKHCLFAIFRLSAIILVLFWGNSKQPFLLSSSQSIQIANYPNPFDNRNSQTTIVFYLEEEAVVSISIYDNLGYFVREFEVFGQLGENKIFWDGENNRGNKVGRGGYLCLVRIEKSGLVSQTILKIGVIH